MCLPRKAPQRAIRIAEKALAYGVRAAQQRQIPQLKLMIRSSLHIVMQAMRLKATGSCTVRCVLGSARCRFCSYSTAKAELVAGLDAVVAPQSAEAMLLDFGVAGLKKTLQVDWPVRPNHA